MLNAYSCGVISTVDADGGGFACRFTLEQVVLSSGEWVDCFDELIKQKYWRHYRPSLLGCMMRLFLVLGGFLSDFYCPASVSRRPSL